MAERERRLARSDGRVFIPRSHVMDANDLRRALVRIAHEILERNHGAEGIVIVGLRTGGVPLAERLVAEIAAIDGTTVPLGRLDVASHRDDADSRPAVAAGRPRSRSTSPAASSCSSTTCSIPAGRCVPPSTP